MNAVIINQVGTFEVEADESGRILKMHRSDRKFYNECPQCNHKNKPYNNYCTMCRWELKKDSVHEDN
jgi:hypothetical protein